MLVLSVGGGSLGTRTVRFIPNSWLVFVLLASILCSDVTVPAFDNGYNGGERILTVNLWGAPAPKFYQESSCETWVIFDTICLLYSARQELYIYIAMITYFVYIYISFHQEHERMSTISITIGYQVGLVIVLSVKKSCSSKACGRMLNQDSGWLRLLNFLAVTLPMLIPKCPAIH